jgi:hypothetical protein
MSMSTRATRDAHQPGKNFAEGWGWGSEHRVNVRIICTHAYIIEARQGALRQFCYLLSATTRQESYVVTSAGQLGILLSHWRCKPEADHFDRISSSQ